MISDINIKVDQDLCYACGLCVERCIMDNLRLALAPCRQACPLDMNCQGYVRLIAQGREKEAAEEMRKDTPFGAILGRVCSHPCEEACERGKTDGPVHIRALKRYLADSYPQISRRLPETAPDTGRRAAVVGSGPAGLMAAYELSRQGHQVTVFEAAAEPGGLLRYGIPSFRLPIDQVEEAVALLAEMGVSFKTGQAIGQKTELGNLEKEFEAVILAVGAGPGRELNIPGQDLDQVIQGLDLLRQVKEGNPPRLGRSVVVIGGGNAAVEAALTCRHLGRPEVRLVCLEDRDQMPAFDLELEEASQQGLVIENGWGPLRFTQQDKGQIRVDLGRCLSLFDKQGRFRPFLDQTCGLRLEADSIVVAIGQRAWADGWPTELIDPITGRFGADPLTCQSPARPKIFVCGDCSTGPASVVEALASGREAAISADRLLRNEGLRWGRQFWDGPYIKEYDSTHREAKGGPRRELAKVALGDRRLDTEVEIILSPQAAKEEAERCLSCGRAAEINRTCWCCLPCEIECPVQALEVRMPYLVR